MKKSFKSVKAKCSFRLPSKDVHNDGCPGTKTGYCNRGGCPTMPVDLSKVNRMRRLAAKDTM